MYLLPLDATEAQIALDAINAYATAVEAEDRSEAATADRVGDRLREMTQLLHPVGREWLRFVGVGPTEGRRQG